MKLETITQCLRARGYSCYFKSTACGIEVGVSIKGTEMWVVGLVPIDDADNEEFADTLADYADAVEQKASAPTTKDQNSPS